MEVTLAIDYGARRVGLAVSAGFLARPLEVVPHGELDALVARILRLAAQEMVTRLVVGLPVHADGTEGEQAAASRHFARHLAGRTPLPVLLFDEYGSSQSAQSALIAGGARRRKRRARLDAVAAAQFLQEFVDRDGQGSERILAEEQQDE